MNRTCNGRSFTIGDEKFYRCLYDGVVMLFDKAFVSKGKVCRQCRRPISLSPEHYYGIVKPYLAEITVEVEFDDGVVFEVPQALFDQGQLQDMFDEYLEE